MEVLSAILGLLIICGFFVIVQTVKKIKYKQDLIYKLMAEQNNLLSEQITIMRDQLER
jgi:hypothetical protein